MYTMACSVTITLTICCLESVAHILYMAFKPCSKWPVLVYYCSWIAHNRKILELDIRTMSFQGHDRECEKCLDNAWKAMTLIISCDLENVLCDFVRTWQCRRCEPVHRSLHGPHDVTQTLCRRSLASYNSCF